MSYSPVNNWLLSVSEGIRRDYSRHLKKFCEFSGLSPEKLVEKAEANRRSVHELAKEYHAKLSSEGLASNTCLRAYSAIRSFFSRNDLPLGKTPRHFHGVVQFETYRIFDPEEISRMIQSATITKDKAIISFLAQSGQRTGTVAALRCRHVRQQIEKGINPVIIEVTGILLNEKGVNVNKGRMPYQFAIGKQTVEYIKRMIKQRKDRGETIDDDSWLFRGHGRVVTRADGKVIRSGKVKFTMRGKPIAAASVTEIFYASAREAGIQNKRIIGLSRNGKTRFHYEMHPHAFRRWWKHQLRQGGVVDSELLNYMMGHRPKYGGAYDNFDADYVRREYSKAERFLTVTPVDTSTTSVQAIPETPASNEEGQHVSPPDGHQKVITEWELESHLASGWQYVAILPSNRIIVGAPPPSMLTATTSRFFREKATKIPLATTK